MSNPNETLPTIVTSRAEQQHRAEETMSSAEDESKLEMIASQYEQLMQKKKEYAQEGIDISPKVGFAFKTFLLGALAKETQTKQQELESASMMQNPLSSLMLPPQVMGPSRAQAPLDADSVLASNPHFKVFVNVCHHPSIEGGKMEVDEGKKEERLRFPLSCNGPHQDVDKDGKLCWVFDVVINSLLMAKALDARKMIETDDGPVSSSSSSYSESEVLLSQLIQTIVSWIQTKHQIQLDDNVKFFKNVHYKGKLPPPSHRVRRTGLKKLIEEQESPNSNSVSSSSSSSFSLSMVSSSSSSSLSLSSCLKIPNVSSSLPSSSCLTQCASSSSSCSTTSSTSTGTVSSKWKKQLNFSSSLACAVAARL
eukprot:TRINITY_DN6193_c0_g1_i1.p1 TRINITY_DN6193_c0_g1~~TRINITY_DN6193_c0_g1_i1.p1  ORF type:complete len:366 (-),score=140.26 TRINITY_DN6193_c0_g1_i1:25-1122(-)